MHANKELLKDKTNGGASEGSDSDPSGDELSNKEIKSIGRGATKKGVGAKGGSQCAPGSLHHRLSISPGKLCNCQMHRRQRDFANQNEGASHLIKTNA